MTKHVVSSAAFAKALSRRLKDERLTERALIVQFLLSGVLVDNAETREAIGDVFEGKHAHYAHEAWAAEA